ncbi:hypothetical protein [Reyranella soli]|uniref:hypothetical protein n=1 Tax=Reyranella soli TaxID=1230389 RepID=UPI0011BF5E8F|nr:hypothetical protein [Reyranella soli]
MASTNLKDRLTGLRESILGSKRLTLSAPTVIFVAWLVTGLSPLLSTDLNAARQLFAQPKIGLEPSALLAFWAVSIAFVSARQ